MSSNAKNVILKLTKDAKTDEDKLKAFDNLNLKFMKIGGHKLRGGNEFVGSRIVYYIKQTKELGIGDKLATRYGKLPLSEVILIEKFCEFSRSLF